MRLLRIATPLPTQPEPPTEGPPWLRFALLCTLFLLAALRLESYLAPLCRATAVQVGALLGLVGLAPDVHGDLITVSGFTVRIVTECTPLYPCLLYGAFVLAQPATWPRTLAGLGTGWMAIALANLLRISFVTAAGPAVSRIVFDILHVYLGQVAMLMLVVAAALVWQRWSVGGPAPFPFLLRAGVLATMFFIPWVAVNRSYVEFLDNLVALLFSILYPKYTLLTPRPFAIYNHTFAVPLFLALVLAGHIAWSLRRMGATVGGICLIAGWHALFRVSHVVWTALDVPAVEPLHQGIYLLGQFLLPFLIWIRMDASSFRQWRAPEEIPVKPVISILLLSLFVASIAQAAEPAVSAYYNGRGGFAIKGENLNRVTEAEIRVEYKSEQKSSPQVSGAGLGAQAAVAVDAGSPGSFTIRLKSSKPMSGHPLLATAQIQGTVTFLTAWLRNDKGATETARASITNPTDEQLSALGGRRPTVNPAFAASPAVKSPANVAPAPVAAPSPQAASAQPVARAHDAAPRTITFSRRKSVLERFLSYSGERNQSALSRLFERRDNMFLQEPPVLLSDGASALRLTIRVRGQGDRAPQFYISGGACIGLKNEDNGSWMLEIVPERGRLATSVTVLSEGEMIEFPLAVAPPIELFDESKAEAGEAEYVTTANRLVLGNASVPRGHAK